MDQNAQINNISFARQVKQSRIFSSALSATAIVSLFVVLAVQLLERI